ncbi:hypothetical protein DXG01_005544, partial [Tephrocybe rancida]
RKDSFHERPVDPPVDGSIDNLSRPSSASDRPSARSLPNPHQRQIWKPSSVEEDTAARPSSGGLGRRNSVTSINPTGSAGMRPSIVKEPIPERSDNEAEYESRNGRYVEPEGHWTSTAPKPRENEKHREHRKSSASEKARLAEEDQPTYSNPRPHRTEDSKPPAPRDRYDGDQQYGSLRYHRSEELLTRIPSNAWPLHREASFQEEYDETFRPYPPSRPVRTKPSFEDSATDRYSQPPLREQVPSHPSSTLKDEGEYYDQASYRPYPTPPSSATQTSVHDHSTPSVGRYTASGTEPPSSYGYGEGLPQSNSLKFSEQSESQPTRRSSESPPSLNRGPSYTQTFSDEPRSKHASPPRPYSRTYERAASASTPIRSSYGAEEAEGWRSWTPDSHMPRREPHQESERRDRYNDRDEQDPEYPSRSARDYEFWHPSPDSPPYYGTHPEPPRREHVQPVRSPMASHPGSYHDSINHSFGGRERAYDTEEDSDAYTDEMETDLEPTPRYRDTVRQRQEAQQELRRREEAEERRRAVEEEEQRLLAAELGAEGRGEDKRKAEARRQAAEAKQLGEGRQGGEGTQRREAEAARKEAESRRKEREAKRRAVVMEEARKEVEAKKEMEEARRKEEEARRKEEEVRRKEEEARRKEEEARRKEEEVRRKEVVAREKEHRVREESWKKEQEMRYREEELKKWEEELQRREREIAEQKEAERLEEEEESQKDAKKLHKQFDEENEQRLFEEKFRQEQQQRQQQEEFMRREQEIQERKRQERKRQERKRQDSTSVSHAPSTTPTPRPYPPSSSTSTANGQTSGWSSASKSSNTSKASSSSSMPKPQSGLMNSTFPTLTHSPHPPSAHDKAEGKHRQEELFQQQQERFRKEQLRFEETRQRTDNTVKLTKEQTTSTLERYERHWSTLLLTGMLTKENTVVHETEQAVHPGHMNSNRDIGITKQKEPDGLEEEEDLLRRLRQQEKSRDETKREEDVQPNEVLEIEDWQDVIRNTSVMVNVGEFQPKESGELQLQEQEEARETRWGARYSAILLKLRSIFSDVTARHYRRLLKCIGKDAQTVLDAFQSLLDADSFPDRGQLVIAMRRLSANTQLYPQRYVIDGPVQLIHDHPVDSGKFADIYKADFQGNPTCLKVIRAHAAPLVRHMAKVYAREAILWGQLSHPNLLPFHGLHKFRSQIAFVAPWAENGNLSDYLNHEPNANRVLLCADTAAGVEYLHANGVVHGDLKALNILVDGSGRACLSDFGLSGVADNKIIKWATQSSAASKGGTSRWQAPELHNPEMDNIHNTKESDIYAWASSSYEVFTGNAPFSEIAKETTVAFRILRGDLPTRPPANDKSWTERGLTEALWELLVDCWKMKPSERPQISAVRSRLEFEMPAEDPRPPGQWGSRFAMRFRNAQAANVAGQQSPSLADLDDILSKVMDDSAEALLPADVELKQ